MVECVTNGVMIQRPSPDRRSLPRDSQIVTNSLLSSSLAQLWGMKQRNGRQLRVGRQASKTFGGVAMSLSFLPRPLLHRAFCGDSSVVAGHEWILRNCGFNSLPYGFRQAGEVRREMVHSATCVPSLMAARPLTGLSCCMHREFAQKILEKSVVEQAAAKCWNGMNRRTMRLRKIDREQGKKGERESE